MKVTGNNYEINKYLSESQAREAQKAQETQAKGNDPAAPRPAASQDVIVELSQKAQEVQMAREALDQQPDMREEKVAALKSQMESGAYKVNPEEVAEKMMRVFMDETG